MSVDGRMDTEVRCVDTTECPPAVREDPGSVTTHVASAAVFYVTGVRERKTRCPATAV